MKLLIQELPETSIVSIGHRPGLEVFHTRELTLVPGKEGAKLTTVRGKRLLVDVYRRLSAVSRAQPREPGFWSTFGDTLLSNLGAPPRRRRRH